MRWISFAGLLGLLLCGFSGCTGGGNGEPAVTNVKPGVGSVAPEIAAAAWMNTDNGLPVTLAAQKTARKFVVMNFCLTTCTYCMDTLDELAALHQTFKDRATFLTLTFEKPEVAAGCAQKHPEVIWAVGAGSTYYLEYQEERVPMYYLISPESIILWVGNDIALLKTAIEGAIPLP